jgi:hypothetical protein
MGVTPGSMSQWKKKKKGTNVGAATLVSALVRLADLKLTLKDHTIGLCANGSAKPTPPPQTGPEQLELFLDYTLAEESSSVARRPIELDQAEDVVLRITVRRATLPPVDNMASKSA